jgi:predicted Fe-Mo cluster-binding NifX family protein
MTLRLSRTPSIAIVAALGVIVTSCGASKVAQCNELIDVANRAVEDVQAIASTAQPDDVNSMIQIAETAERAQTEMEALELSDEQLQGFQQRFITMYSQTSSSTRELVNAFNAQDNAAAETAYQDLQTATGQETSLVNEVNAYCSGG